jgi:acyl-CoA thioester hydrolase
MSVSQQGPIDPAARDWERANPHVLRRAVEPADIDDYAHVNNAVYLHWLDLAAWSHSTALGVPPQRCLALRRGMVVHRVNLEYARAAVAGDVVEIGTWLVRSDGRLRCERRFQIRRSGDLETLLSGTIEYVCMNLDTGRAVRMPPDFIAAYRAAGAALPQP